MEKAMKINSVTSLLIFIGIIGLLGGCKPKPATISVEIESLIAEGFSILERWAFYYEVKTEIPRLVSGKDDYLFVLKSLRNGKECHSQNLNLCSSVSIRG